MKRTQKHGATVIFSKSPLSLSTKSVSKVSSLSLSPQTSLGTFYYGFTVKIAIIKIKFCQKSAVRETLQKRAILVFFS